MLAIEGEKYVFNCCGICARLIEGEAYMFDGESDALLV